MSHCCFRAPHRRCASSPVRLNLAILSLIMPLLLLSPTVHAGTYTWQTTNANGRVTAQSPTYTGGTLTTTPNGTIYPFALNRYVQDGIYRGTTTGGCSSDGYGYATAGALTAFGPLTAKFTWKPDYPGDLPPQCVIMQQNCSVGATNMRTGGNVEISCIVDDGLGGGDFGDFSGAYSSSTQYSVKSVEEDGSVSVTCSPSAIYSANTGAGPASFAALAVGISYSATVSPVHISLLGTTKNSSNGDNILVGQNCRAILSADSRPSELTFGYPTWAIPGNTYTEFNIGPNQSSGNATDWNLTYGPLNIAGNSPEIEPYFYWGDNGCLHGSAPFTVVATAPLNYTNGNTSVTIGYVYASKNINVWTPELDDTPLATGGQTFAANPELGVVGLEDGRVKSATGGAVGFFFEASVVTPSLFTLGGDFGAWAWLQLVKINQTQGSNGTQMADLELDSSFPYNTGGGAGNGLPGTPMSASPSRIGGPVYNAFPDTPDAPYYLYQNAVTFDDSFSLYVMYKPPDAGFGANWVPLYLYNWDFSCNMSRSTALSSWTPNPPGSVTFGGGHPHPDYPTWNAKFPP